MDAAERDTHGVEVPNPDGGSYTFKPLPFKRARYWWGELRTAQEHGYGGLFETVEAFADEVETTDGVKLSELSFNVPEVFAIAGRFLARTRPGWSPWPDVAGESSTSRPNTAQPTGITPEA